MLRWLKLSDGSGYKSNLWGYSNTYGEMSPMFLMERDGKRFNLFYNGNIIARRKPFSVCSAIATLII